MRLILSWLLMMGILTSLSARITRADSGLSTFCSHSGVNCCDHHSNDSHGEDDCPLEHHHHQGCCSTSQTLAFEIFANHPLNICESIRLAAGHEHEIPPEKPFLSLGKPPLI